MDILRIYPVSSKLRIVQDAKHLIQGDKLAKVIKASGNEVEAYWPTLFAKALKGQNIEELLSNIGSAAPVAAAPVGAPVAAAAGAPAAAAKKEEQPNEEEADVDMGGLFGEDYLASRVTYIVAIAGRRG